MKKTEITEEWHATKELQIYTENTQSLQTAARILETLGLSKRITQHSTDKPLLKNLQRLPMAHSAEFNLPFPTSKLREILYWQTPPLLFLLPTLHLHASARARSSTVRPPVPHPLPHITAYFLPLLFT